MAITINEKFKTFVSTSYKVSKLIYFVLIHALLFFYSPFVKYQSDEQSTIITIDVLDYHKTVLLQNE